MALTVDIFFSMYIQPVLMILALTNPPSAASLLWILHVWRKTTIINLVYQPIALQWNTSKPGVWVVEGDRKHAG